MDFVLLHLLLFPSVSEVLLNFLLIQLRLLLHLVQLFDLLLHIVCYNVHILFLHHFHGLFLQSFLNLHHYFQNKLLFLLLLQLLLFLFQFNQLHLLQRLILLLVLFMDILFFLSAVSSVMHLQWLLTMRKRFLLTAFRQFDILIGSR